MGQESPARQLERRASAVSTTMQEPNAAVLVPELRSEVERLSRLLRDCRHELITVKQRHEYLQGM